MFAAVQAAEKKQVTHLGQRNAFAAVQAAEKDWILRSESARWFAAVQAAEKSGCTCVAVAD